jgi:hypothetical protein
MKKQKNKKIIHCGVRIIKGLLIYICCIPIANGPEALRVNIEIFTESPPSYCIAVIVDMTPLWIEAHIQGRVCV